MASALILGGTRNLGHCAALELLRAGHSVTLANRGITPDELPTDLERLRADRSRTGELAAALRGRSFDLVFDTTTYTGADARQAVALFAGHVGRYVFVSSGQVYLVLAGSRRPYSEADYEGPLLPEPFSVADRESWRYGVGKRDAEDTFAEAYARQAFPVTTLRLPMVAAERDHLGRVQAYVARLLDGGPILVPDETGLPLRHVYVRDVARLVRGLLSFEGPSGRAYNISWGGSVSLPQFLEQLAGIVGRQPRIARVPRPVLEAHGLLPGASPFSGLWMSELDNSRGLAELSMAGLSYTPPEEYLNAIAADYELRWLARSAMPSGYDRRAEELAIGATYGS